MSWNPFNKPPLTFEVGYKDAQRQMNDLLERSYSEDGAIDKLSDLYKKYCDPKSPTASWLPYGKGQDKYLEGYRAFLESVIQARFSVPEQIHPETNVNLACDLLEFLTVPPAPKQIALDDYNLEKYEEAEAYFEMLMQKEQMTALEAYQLMVSDRCINNWGSLGFQAFLSNQAFALTDRDKLESNFRLNAKEYPQCEGV